MKQPQNPFHPADSLLEEFLEPGHEPLELGVREGAEELGEVLVAPFQHSLEEGPDCIGHPYDRRPPVLGIGFARQPFGRDETIEQAREGAR